MWLTGTNTNDDPNNFLYKDITIDMNRLMELPENGYLEISDLEVDCCKNDNDVSGNKDEFLGADFEQNENDLPDLGPVFDNEECVFDENTEMGSFIPSKMTFFILQSMKWILGCHL